MEGAGSSFVVNDRMEVFHFSSSSVWRRLGAASFRVDVRLLGLLNCPAMPLYLLPPRRIDTANYLHIASDWPIIRKRLMNHPISPTGRTKTSAPWRDSNSNLPARHELQVVIIATPRQVAFGIQTPTPEQRQIFRVSSSPIQAGYGTMCEERRRFILPQITRIKHSHNLYMITILSVGK